MKVDKNTRDLLLKIKAEKRVILEGNILKVLEADPDDKEFKSYLESSLEKDKDNRRRRLEVTKRVQDQNTSLLKSQNENQKLMEELRLALETAENAKLEAISSKEEAESAKEIALNDLDVLQKKSQTELIGTIVRVALFIILSVGIITTIMYGIAMITQKDTQIIGSTWSNMFGILLTNAFSIVGTIMGVKYASEDKNKN